MFCNITSSLSYNNLIDTININTKLNIGYILHDADVGDEKPVSYIATILKGAPEPWLIFIGSAMIVRSFFDFKESIFDKSTFSKTGISFANRILCETNAVL